MRTAALLGFVLMLIAAACAGSRDTRASRPSGLVVSLAKGGGFSGLWQGYIVREDGTLETYRGPTAADAGTLRGHLPESALDSLWTLLHEAQVFGMVQDERGNLTGRIAVHTADTTATLWWVADAAPDPPPGSAEALYRDLLGLVTRHLDS